jgi:hypothetical protein
VAIALNFLLISKTIGDETISYKIVILISINNKYCIPLQILLMQDVTNCGNLLKPLIPSIAAMYMDTCEKLQDMVKTQKIYGKSAAKVFMKNHKEQSSETRCTSVGNPSHIRYSPPKFHTLKKCEKTKIFMKK